MPTEQPHEGAKPRKPLDPKYKLPPAVRHALDPGVGGGMDARPKELWTPEDGLIYYRAIGGRLRMQCTARPARTRSDAGYLRCEGTVTPGMRVCYHHGGSVKTNRRGVYTQGGRYSGALRDAAAKLFEAQVVDPDLLRTERDVALIGARAETMIERAQEGDTPNFRRVAVELFGEVESAVRANNTARASTALAELKQHLSRGAESDKAWEVAVRHVERRAHRAERAREVAARERVSFSMEEMRATLAMVADVLVSQLGDGADKLISEITLRMRTAQQHQAIQQFRAGQALE